jgi:hypothetical protein
MQTTSEPTGQWGNRRRTARVRTYIAVVTCAAVVLVAAVAAAMRSTPSPSRPAGPVSYVGVYESGAPNSYAGINQFAQAIGRQPNLVSYYSAWLEPFQRDFAASAEKHGAVTLVQIDARNISLTSIANGQYDSYLQNYATAVKAFGGQVILSFDHEMNGNWYSWGYGHATPTDFVAAWRHIVDIFRDQRTTNVTWLWTVNIIDTLDDHVVLPGPWWPGSSYVNWVGIDGYYYSPSTTFSSLFGPTIADVREITNDPILIAETGAARSAGQPNKISDMFTGVRTFGLLGLVLFDENGDKATQTWRISSPAAYAALRQEVKESIKPPS